MSKLKVPNYIGITDFTDRSQVDDMLVALDIIDVNRPVYQLGVGVMMSYKTLHGLASRFDGVFPPKESVAEIFTTHPLAYNVLHYADYQGIDILDSLIQVVNFSGPNLRAIQLDMIWPNSDDIREFKKLYPHINVIIQINSHALNLVDCDPLKLVTKLQDYGDDTIDGVLLDMSMGRGLPMSWLKLLPYLAAINNSCPDIQLIVAGGLGPQSLHLVEPLIKCFVPKIGIDAQGKLRPSGSYLEPINWEMAKEYLILAVKMFQSNIFKYEI
ncbi:hypothetical protein GW933_04560 [Candidatus Falkowbacteria bacterium]|uniref:Uncharacterized protein n=1 Tax=Candidatus Buchananbacteria bacterium CG10_big_fil_rev_8_21_14_0_10_33_19 TaxID=1974525 RepID=A0A2H0W538_9BACT|nr:hypothetical protein [Candidatus Falkowbacteria bacterium]PIS06397.1 MAG: hypothetical protein COT80_00435 [Candidatus Buchananbacteria bacterium CG10_big_fil_rev_8_21_14_0_10_33_19]